MISQDPAPKPSLLRHGLSLVVGVAVGIFLHYLLFRLTLPVQPFIYVSF